MNALIYLRGPKQGEMPFVRSPEDVRRLQAILQRPTFTGLRSIAATFRTDPDAVRRLLPPPLEPAEPLGRVWIGDVQASNIAGGFAGAGLDIAARHGAQNGWYCLFMPMSTDTAVQVGRETLGEPKKLCEIALERDGAHVRGSVARRGVTLIRLDLALGDPVGPMESSGVSFHYKYSLACDGAGYDAPPRLVYATHHLSAENAVPGQATVAFASTVHDSVADLPVGEVLSGMYVEGADVVEARIACDVDGEAFLPWAFAGTDDWLLFQQVQKRAAGLAKAGA